MFKWNDEISFNGSFAVITHNSWIESDEQQHRLINVFLMTDIKLRTLKPIKHQKKNKNNPFHSNKFQYPFLTILEFFILSKITFSITHFELSSLFTSETFLTHFLIWLPCPFCFIHIRQIDSNSIHLHFVEHLNWSRHSSI